MEYISLNFVQHNIMRQYGKQKASKTKINNYFASFIDKHQDAEYAWIENKLYLPTYLGFQMRKELEKALNKPVREIEPKKFDSTTYIELITSVEAKKKCEIRRKIIKENVELRKQNTKDEFHKVIDNVKAGKDGFKIIGAFDLEFWEQDMDLILEFGWQTIDYNGESQTTHLVVQENLKYENGQFSKNNRFARKDTQIVPLKIAMERFQKEFLDKTDVYVGHGLENDFKVLKKNGMDLKLDYYDTADIGAVFMDEDHKVSLERLLDHLEIKHDNLHNAANDVEYILKALFELGDL